MTLMQCYASVSVLWQWSHLCMRSDCRYCRKHQAQKNSSGTNKHLLKLWLSDDRRQYAQNWATRALDKKTAKMVRTTYRRLVGATVDRELTAVH